MKAPRFAMVAGEASGDLLAGLLLDGMQARWPQLHAAGIGGPRMAARGFDVWWPSERLAVRGYVEVLRHLPGLLRLRGQLARRVLAERPDAFIGIDAPDFNLGLEAKLKAAGIPTVHYVSPSLWAWRPERIHSIAKSVDHMLVLFPFEEEIYRKANVPVTYVGHPFADEMPLEPDRREARAQLRLGASNVGVALLPGSRLSELEYHADLVIETARELHGKRPDLRFFVPLATRETRDYFENRLYSLEAREIPITILFGHARLALHACDVALVKSGTATLEAALARCPLVVTYRVSRFTYWLMKRKSVLPDVALPNILEGEFVVPELLQEEATPGNLAQALGNWLDNRTARERLRRRFASLHESLAKGHDERVAHALAPYLNRDNTNNARCEDFAAGPRVAMRGR
jgi:lipid-A-disaccharide synthase